MAFNGIQMQKISFWGSRAQNLPWLPPPPTHTNTSHKYPSTPAALCTTQHLPRTRTPAAHQDPVERFFLLRGHEAVAEEPGTFIVHAVQQVILVHVVVQQVGDPIGKVTRSEQVVAVLLLRELALDL